MCRYDILFCELFESNFWSHILNSFQYFCCFIVPISVVASFKKIKALISSHSQLAAVLRNSSKLVSVFIQSCFK